MSRLITVVLLALVLVLPAGRGLAVDATPPDPEAPVVVYYFHRDLRCHTCLMIESMAQDDVTVTMAADVESGRLAWRLVNYQRPENAHYSEVFDLEGPGLVVARYDTGKLMEWAILDRVWELTDDIDAFDTYVLGAVEKYLETASAKGHEAGNPVAAE